MPVSFLSQTQVDFLTPNRVQVIKCNCAYGQCGFFKRKQREQLIRKKRESTRLFEQEVDDVDEVAGTSGNDVIDEGRGLGLERDVLPEKHSLYDNDEDAPW